MARRWHRGAGRSWAEAAGARLPGPETKKAGQGPAFVPLPTAVGGLFLRRGGRAVVAHPVGLAVERRVGLLLATLAVHDVGQHAGADDRRRGSHRDRVATDGAGRDAGAGAGGTQGGASLDPVLGTVAGVAQAGAGVAAGVAQAGAGLLGQLQRAVGDDGQLAHGGSL